MAKEIITQGEDGSLRGMLILSKMGDSRIFRIRDNDLDKFRAKRYHAVLTPLE